MSRWILITGGAGYVGSVLVDELLRDGYRVRVLDSLLHGSVPSLLLAWGNESFDFMRGDVRDPDARRHALADVEAVVHLAAIVGDPACARQPELARSVNLDATRSLLVDAGAAGVERFVLASTCSNYGRVDAGALATEESPLSPVSLYAETKVAAELEVLAHSQDGVATCCLRFATVYGTSPRMRFDLTVNEFAREVALSRELVVFGEQFWRPYIHVRDAARAVRLVLQSSSTALRGNVFNVGDTAENYRKLDIVELLKERVSDANVRFVHRDEDPRDYRVSFEKAKTSLGFNARSSVADGVDEVIALLRSGLIADPFAPAYKN